MKLNPSQGTYYADLFEVEVAAMRGVIMIGRDLFRRHRAKTSLDSTLEDAESTLVPIKMAKALWTTSNYLTDTSAPAATPITLCGVPLSA